MEFLSESPQETQEWARKLGSRLSGDELILLSGEMGAGKTLFCKGLAEALGIDPDEVVSPTFTLMNCFEGTHHALHHLDLYRLGHEPGCIRSCPDIDDQLGYGVVVVEWPEYLTSQYRELKQTLLVEITITGDESRRLCIGGPRAAGIIAF
jgi:tRNA threonylcarbamoyladenosine biosynthesis protein TsaE